MKRPITLIAFLLGLMFVQAQEITHVKPYFYDEFRPGTVFFTEGAPVRALMNYSFVSQKMLFVNPDNHNEILNLVRQPNMTHIEIGYDVFVPIQPHGFAHVISYGPITLLKRKRIFLEADRRGAYGIPTNTATVNVLSSFSSIVGSSGDLPDGLGSRTQVIAHNTLEVTTRTRTEQRFYLMRDRVAIPVTRRNFLSLHREIRPQLETFISENSINFRNEQHVRSLTIFANSLLMAIAQE